MKLRLAYLTNRGKLRSRNEDALLVKEKILSGISMDKPEFMDIESDELLLAVADGMGGMPCGDRASRMALDLLKRLWNEYEVPGLLKEITDRMNDYVAEHPECFGMGTALAGLFLGKERAIAFNVGDCRVYRYRTTLQLLTRDHTEAYELLEKGVIDEEELRFHHLRNLLTSALMGGYRIDLKVHIKEIKVSEGDMFLLCSDGLWDELSVNQMEECLSLGVDYGSLCLFEKAYVGGKDNISFILAKVL